MSHEQQSDRSCNIPGLDDHYHPGQDDQYKARQTVPAATYLNICIELKEVASQLQSCDVAAPRQQLQTSRCDGTGVRCVEAEVLERSQVP